MRSYCGQLLRVTIHKGESKTKKILYYSIKHFIYYMNLFGRHIFKTMTEKQIADWTKDYYQWIATLIRNPEGDRVRTF